MKLIAEITGDAGQHLDYSLKESVMFFKGKIWIPAYSALQPLLLSEFHTTPMEGQVGVSRTLVRIASTFFSG